MLRYHIILLNNQIAQLYCCVYAGFRCDNYQMQQSTDVSRTQRVLSEASERLLSEFALRHGIVRTTFLNVTEILPFHNGLHG